MLIFQWVKAYCLTLLVFLIIDFLWLGLLANRFYQRNLSGFLSEQINWVAAFVFYGLFVLGMVIFVIHPAIEDNNIIRAALLGMLYGLVTYATYDLTNLALIKDWPLKVVIVDIAWGIVLNGIVSTIGFWIAKRFS